MKTAATLILCATAAALQAGEARFDFFNYTGTDSRPGVAEAIARNDAVVNPVLTGFYPDPSVCRKDDTYYLVNSTFSYFPGVPLFTSKDLAHWTQLGNVFDRPSQLDVTHPDVSTGVFAPAISYNPKNGLFYMITTVCWSPQGNCYVTSADPAKGWSEPVRLDPSFDGIDPSFFFDDDGKAYIVHNTDPEGGAAYDGQRAIRVWEFDVASGKLLGRDHSRELTKGSRPEEKPIWPEGPHIFKHGDWYYLTCAEGGTSMGHTEVVFRGKSPMGPFTPNPANPILTQRDLAPDRAAPITCAGHAQLVEAPDGKWWSVFLACRPVDGCSFLGRETFVLPVEWKDDWPVILPPKTAVPVVVPKVDLAAAEGPAMTGSFTRNEAFDAAPGMEWMFLYPASRNYAAVQDGKLVLDPRAATLRDRAPSAALFRRQAHTDYTVETKFDFLPETDGDCAGVALFQNESFNTYFGKTKTWDGLTAFVVSRREGNAITTEGLVTLPRGANWPTAWLKIEAKGRFADFLYSLDGKDFKPVATHVDLSNLAPEKAGGFVGVVMGPFATRKWQSFALSTRH